MSSGKKTTGNPSGRKPKHGSRMLERLIRENRIDGRTGIAKMLKDVADDLAHDVGGWDALTNRERILVERAAAQTVILSSIEAYVFRQPSLLTEATELLPVLKRGYVSHANALRLTLQALGLRPERSNKVPSLAEYLASKANGAGSSQQPASDHATAASAAPTANGGE